MRSIWRTLDRALLRDVAAVAAAVAVVGASFGAIAAAAGLSPWMALVMSLLVFAGASQFMAVGVIASGGSAVAAVVAALVLNLRHLPFGLAVADALGTRWPAKLLGAHLMIDESVAFAMAQRDPAKRKAAFWTSSITLFLAWNPAVVIGGYVGQTLADPAAFGVYAAFPAALLALLMPTLKQAEPRRVALLGAAVAVAATPLLPPGLPVLLGLLGLVAVLPVPTRKVAR